MKVRAYVIGPKSSNFTPDPAGELTAFPDPYPAPLFSIVSFDYASVNYSI